MNPQQNEFMLLTDKIESYHKNELSEEKIAKNIGATWRYTLALILIFIGLLGTVIPVFISDQTFFEDKTALYITGSGIALSVISAWFRNWIITTSILKRYPSYKKNIRNKFSFTNTNKMLQLHRYELLRTKLTNNEYRSLKANEIAPYFAKQSDDISKSRLFPITIYSVLLVAVWAGYASSMLSDPKLATDMKFNGALALCLIASIISLAVFGFVKWFEAIFLNRPKSLKQLSALLEMIEINEGGFVIEPTKASRQRNRHRANI